MKTARLFLFCALSLLAVSCSGRITGAIQVDERSEFLIEASLSAGVSRILSPLAPRNGAPVLDASLISASLKEAPGIAGVSLKNTASDKIAGGISFSKVSSFLMADGRRFITWDQRATEGRALITLSRVNAPLMLQTLSREALDYISAIMAPLATGEELTKSEYLRLVTSVYGKQVAGEIESAEVTAQIQFPGMITEAAGNGAAFQGSTVRITISLLDLLVLERPLSYEVRWTPFR